MAGQFLVGCVVLMYALMSKCGVVAQDAAVRLTGSINPREGRLEVLYNGTWGTVCDDGFTDLNAQVACAGLGFGYAGEYIRHRYGAGSGKIWLDSVNCTGNERSIDTCRHRDWGTHDCTHDEDVSIRCGSRVRLIGSDDPREGRLEIRYNDVWGTVCDDGFTDNNAAVVCASLGFGYVGSFIGINYPGGSDPIWLDEVHCIGTERSIDECPHNGWGTTDCSHVEDISIRCYPPTTYSTTTSSPVSSSESYAGWKIMSAMSSQNIVLVLLVLLVAVLIINVGLVIFGSMIKGEIRRMKSSTNSLINSLGQTKGNPPANEIVSSEINIAYVFPEEEKHEKLAAEESINQQTNDHCTLIS